MFGDPRSDCLLLLLVGLNLFFTFPVSALACDRDIRPEATVRLGWHLSRWTVVQICIEAHGSTFSGEITVARCHWRMRQCPFCLILKKRQGKFFFWLADCLTLPR